MTEQNNPNIYNSGINYAKVIGLQFSTLSSETIEKTAVVEVLSKSSYENGKPTMGGLFDPRMGVLEPGSVCITDGNDYMQTPGYYGFMRSPVPLFQLQNMPYILGVLNCVCYECSKLLISKTQHKHILSKTAAERWKYVKNLAKDVKRCGDQTEDGCGCLQPTKIRKDGIAMFVAEWKSKDPEEPTKMVKIRGGLASIIFKRISDEDCHFFGSPPLTSRPDNQITNIILVSSQLMRPSVKHDAQQHSEDDQTHFLLNIMKNIKIVQDKIQQGAKANIIDEYTVLLNYYYSCMSDNEISGADQIKQRSGRPLKSIKDRINGKHGRLRENLMAKRVDFSARSVITADPNISIRQVGVPIAIAMIITIPEIVNAANISYLSQLVLNGTNVYPGANTYRPANSNASITLKYIDKRSIKLEIGDIVHRHMRDDDDVLFNRQPSLHKMSTMGHKAKIMFVGSTFRLNVAVTKPYNADFDGDEMNLHCPQSIEAATELRLLANVEYQMISPSHNGAIIGIFQDNMLGTKQFTERELKFSSRDAMNLIMSVPSIDLSTFGPILNSGTVTNFQIMSQIMPPMSIKYKNKLFDTKNGDTMETSNNIIEIHNGKYIRGQLDKNVMYNATSKNLIHRICNDFGNRAASNFIDDHQNIITAFMKYHGFSVGIADLISDESTKQKITTIINAKKNEVKMLLDQVRIGVMHNVSGKSNEDEIELQINNILNNAASEAGKINLKNLSPLNSFIIMVVAGSKGSELNISQMMSCIGQQNVDGKRIGYGFPGRTLPHFQKFDDSPGARGFVESSYISGLTPQELFFHAMGGRVGLIDTAVKTSVTGYIQRRIVKALEILVVNYCMTVRTGTNNIVQYRYGDDGINTMKVEDQDLPLISMSIVDIYAHFNIPYENLMTNSLLRIFTKSTLSRFMAQFEDMIAICEEKTNYIIKIRPDLIQNVFDSKNIKKEKVHAPVAFEAIINNVIGQQMINSNSMVDITVVDASKMIDRAYNNLVKIRTCPPTELFRVLWTFYLSPSQLIFVKRFNRIALEILLETLVVTYKRAVVPPGEMVGLLAAQSVGEIGTQMSVCKTARFRLVKINSHLGKVECVHTPIGDFCDNLIKAYPDRTHTIVDHSKVKSDDEESESDDEKSDSDDDKSETVCEESKDDNIKVAEIESDGEEFESDDEESDAESEDCEKSAELPKENRMLSVETDIQTLEDKYYVNSVDENEKTHWSQISHISRHPVNGGMMRVKTRTGRSIEATMSHSFVTRIDHKVKPITGSDLVVGMCVPTNRRIAQTYEVNTVEIGDETYELDWLFGWFMGAYLAEGNVSGNNIVITSIQPHYEINSRKFAERFDKKINTYVQAGEYGPGQKNQFSHKHFAKFLVDNFKTGSFVKQIPAFMYTAPNVCKAGLLQGYFDGDGNIQCDSRHRAIRSCSRSQQLPKDLAMLFAYFGITTNLTTEQIAGTPMYNINVTPKCAKLYKEHIGSVKHTTALDAIIAHFEKDIAHLDYIDKIPGAEHPISRIATALCMPGQSRTYGSYARKGNTIGRDTIAKYYGEFCVWLDDHETGLAKNNPALIKCKVHGKSRKPLPANLREIVEPDMALIRQAITADVIWDEIVEIERYTPPVDEYVYDFTVPGDQTFMTDYGVYVHNTLNSVTYETEIIVRDQDRKIAKHQIGDFIEAEIKNAANKHEYYEDKDTKYSALTKYYEIPSCDEDGNVTWKRIEAVTRHPVVNKDGSNTMLKITTSEQREVIATKAKSFLKLTNGKIVATDGDALKVGDYLPVSKMTVDFAETRTLDLRCVLPPTEYIYMTEVEKALVCMAQGGQWWNKHSGVTFVVPHKRSDTFRDKFSDKIRKGCKTTTKLKSGCVYMLQTNMCEYEIPEVIDLDYNFGYLVGAYAAEGCMTDFQLSISNNDAAYFGPIIELCEKWNITTKIYTHNDKNQTGWTSQDIRIYNTLLCRILEIFCGKLSHNKFVSDKIIFSNSECLCGYLDAYIGGDGCVDLRGKTISVSSVSKQLLLDTQQILNIKNVYSYITKYKKQETNNRGSLDIKQLYTLMIKGKQNYTLGKILNIKILPKQAQVTQLLDHCFKYNIHKKNTIIPDEIDGVVVLKTRSEYVDKSTANESESVEDESESVEDETESVEDETESVADETESVVDETESVQTINDVREVIYKDIMFDKIKFIEEVPNTTAYAYDLTIAGNKTFNIYNGTAIFDTFHFAGISSKSNVTTGVPRLEEILNLSKDPSKPSLTIYLHPYDEQNKEAAYTIMNMLEYTKLSEVVETIEICFDPDNMETLIKEDEETLAQYREFEQLMDNCTEEADTNDTEKSKWIIRMVMNAPAMLDKNITMDDINFTLNNLNPKDSISCVYSDYNSDKLVFRIRMRAIIPKMSSKDELKYAPNPLDQMDQIFILKNFQDMLLNNIVLRGTKGLHKVVMREIEDLTETNGKYATRKIWVLDTIGSNLLDVLGLDYIDKERTFSNNITEIMDVLGIEAARQTIYTELSDAIEFDGTYVNYHHLSLLCDRMTYSWKLIPISRHGINNDNIGPIAKMSFEETPKMAIEAALHGEYDNMRGISANVMCGQEGYYGTSAFQLLLDMETMQKNAEVAKYEAAVTTIDIDDMLTNVEDPNGKCSTKRLTIDSNIMNIKKVDLGTDDEYNPFA